MALCFQTPRNLEKTLDSRQSRCSGTRDSGSSRLIQGQPPGTGHLSSLGPSFPDCNRDSDQGSLLPGFCEFFTIRLKNPNPFCDPGDVFNSRSKQSLSPSKIYTFFGKINLPYESVADILFSGLL